MPSRLYMLSSLQTVLGQNMNLQGGALALATCLQPFARFLKLDPSLYRVRLDSTACHPFGRSASSRTYGHVESR